MANEERAKLRTLLNYWMEHNKEHSQEFREWADKVKGFGEAEVAEEMLQAVQEMDKASERLLQALKLLEKKEL
jgi:nickel/cobalt exporter